MGLRKWLLRADARNQAVADALLGQPHIEGSGVIILSRWSQGEWGGYREGGARVSIDGDERTGLLWGSTFHQLPPGTHHLSFGSRGFRNTKAEITITVPVVDHVQVEYQPAVWPWQHASVKVVV